MAKNRLIKYICKVDTGKKIVFDVDLNRAARKNNRNGCQPAWTALSFYKCSNCTLTASQTACCPAALDIKEIAELFSSLSSHSKIEVTVETFERTCYKKCDAQTALSSLFGVVMATSACPWLSQLKSIALFHLPFASLDETIFRIVGGYLMQQYYKQKSDGAGDFLLIGLKQFYEEIQTLNIDFTKRIKAGSHFDANINALIKLFILSEAISISLEESLEKFRKYYYEQDKIQNVVFS